MMVEPSWNYRSSSGGLEATPSGTRCGPTTAAGVRHHAGARRECRWAYLTKAREAASCHSGCTPMPSIEP